MLLEAGPREGDRRQQLRDVAVAATDACGLIQKEIKESLHLCCAIEQQQRLGCVVHPCKGSGRLNLQAVVPQCQGYGLCGMSGLEL